MKRHPSPADVGVGYQAVDLARVAELVSHESNGEKGGNQRPGLSRQLGDQVPPPLAAFDQTVDLG